MALALRYVDRCSPREGRWACSANSGSPDTLSGVRQGLHVAPIAHSMLVDPEPVSHAADLWFFSRQPTTWSASRSPNPRQRVSDLRFW